MPENGGELDESVLNPVSARARSVSNLVQKVRRLKPKRSVNRSNDQAARRRKLIRSKTEGRPQAGSTGGSIISVFRSLRCRNSTFAVSDPREKWQRPQGERWAIIGIIWWITLCKRWAIANWMWGAQCMQSQSSNCNLRLDKNISLSASSWPTYAGCGQQICHCGSCIYNVGFLQA